MVYSGCPLKLMWHAYFDIFDAYKSLNDWSKVKTDNKYGWNPIYGKKTDHLRKDIMIKQDNSRYLEWQQFFDKPTSRSYCKTLGVNDKKALNSILLQAHLFNNSG